MTFFERLEELRNTMGLSQGKLEKELGISNGSISKWRNSTPTVKTMQKIAEYFGVTVNYLMSGEDAPDDSARNSELSNVYFSLAKEAEQNGIDPNDIKMAIDMIKKLRGE